MRIMFAGGGTGGHLYPALALAEALRELDPATWVGFMGTPERIEARLVPEAGHPFFPVAVVGMPRRLGPELVSFGGKLLAGLREARRVLRTERPDMVVGTGGYVSAPAVLAAFSLGIPVALCEQNVFPGLANRVLARLARVVFTTFAASDRYFGGRAECRGNPIRREVHTLDRATARERLGFPATERLLLVTGGSLGAQVINQAMVAAAPALLAHPDWSVLHVTGPREHAAIQAIAPSDPRYRVAPYLEDMPVAIAASDLVLSRAGATTVAELTAAGKPMVLVPFEHGGKDQPANARALAAAGAAVIRVEAALADLDQLLGELVTEAPRREAMAAASRAQGRPEAARDIALRLRELAAP